MTGNLSASILARLPTLAKQLGDDYNQRLNRFGMERLLARVSISPHADRFLLKGACSAPIPFCAAIPRCTRRTTTARSSSKTSSRHGSR